LHSEFPGATRFTAVTRSIPENDKLKVLVIEPGSRRNQPGTRCQR